MRIGAVLLFASALAAEGFDRDTLAGMDAEVRGVRGAGHLYLLVNDEKPDDNARAWKITLTLED